jgi:hypothetical protein
MSVAMMFYLRRSDVDGDAARIDDDELSVGAETHPRITDLNQKTLLLRRRGGDTIEDRAGVRRQVGEALARIRPVMIRLNIR